MGTGVREGCVSEGDVAAMAKALARWVGVLLPARILLMTDDGLRAWMDRRGRGA